MTYAHKMIMRVLPELVFMLLFLGLLVWGVDFMVVFFGEGFLEYIGLIPQGWYALHWPGMLIAAAVIGLPSLVYAAVRVTCNAYKYELQILEQGPSEPVE